MGLNTTQGQYLFQVSEDGQVLPKQVGDFGSVGIEAGVGVGHVESAVHLMPEGFPKESVEFPVGVHRYLLDRLTIRARVKMVRSKTRLLGPTSTIR